MRKAKVKLLTGGNPQIAKADGDALDEAQMASWVTQAVAGCSTRWFHVTLSPSDGPLHLREKAVMLIRYSIVLLLSSLIWPAAVGAQAVTGTVEGRFTDAQGAVLPGVTITAVNTA